MARKKGHSFILLLAVFLCLSCRPTPEKLIEKAHTALKHEDSDTALLYMKNAYEVSLPKEFFLVDRDLSFSFLRSADSGEKVLLVERKVARKEFDQVKLTLLDRKKNNEITEKMSGKILNAHLSQNGEYAVFLQKPAVVKSKDKPVSACTIFVWSFQKEKISEVGPSACKTKLAVTSKGKIFFLKNERVNVYDVEKQLTTLFAGGKKPVRPLAKFTANGYFYLSPNEKAYLVYGSAGSYYLYSLEKKMNLLSKELSSYRVYFIPGSDSPGVVVGGAGLQQFVMYATDSTKVKRRLKARAWTDAAFISDKHYYTIEDAILTEKKGLQEEELPFWAEQLAIGRGNELLFLSSTGSAMRYVQRQPSEESMKIYEKGVEIDDSK